MNVACTWVLMMFVAFAAVLVVAIFGIATDEAFDYDDGASLVRVVVIGQCAVAAVVLSVDLDRSLLWWAVVPWSLIAVSYLSLASMEL